MSTFRGLFGIALFILGLCSFWVAAKGLFTGEIMNLSKQGHEILHQSLMPERFWIAVVFWFIGAVLLLSGGFKLAKDNL